MDTMLSPLRNTKRINDEINAYDIKEVSMTKVNGQQVHNDMADSCITLSTPRGLLQRKRTK